MDTAYTLTTKARWYAPVRLYTTCDKAKAAAQDLVGEDTPIKWFWSEPFWYGDASDSTFFISESEVL